MLGRPQLATRGYRKSSHLPRLLCEHCESLGQAGRSQPGQLGPSVGSKSALGKDILHALSLFPAETRTSTGVGSASPHTPISAPSHRKTCATY